MEYKPLSSEKEFIDTQNVDINTIARFFKVQDSYLMEYHSATFRNAETSDILFKKLLPKVECLYFERLPRKEKKKRKKTGFVYGHFYIGLK